MASTSNETKPTQVSFPSTIFHEYLSSREKALYFYHPQWDLTNEEISLSSDLLKRDGTPICIPPSWDLVGRYVGPDDERADGFDEEIYKKEKHLFAGDRSESQFLDVMRDLPIGGVLIGDIYSRDLKHVLPLDNAFADQDTKLREFLNGFREQCLISGMFPKFILKNSSKTTPILAEDFQLDFLYFHQSGMYHFEIKTRRNGKKDDEQLERNLQILKNLFAIFCRQIGEEKSAEFWSCYFRRSLIFYVNGIRKHEEPPDFIESVKIFGKEELEEFWLQENNLLSSKKLFKHEIYRNFLLFLAGFRPDFFICPVTCALFLRKNIFSNRVNTVNYYRKGDVEGKIQNDAKTVTEFLQELKFVKNVEIDFGEYKNIYLTPQQQGAVGSFDGDGNFSPKRQLIFGPPGSGKSLILMLKIFILGQMETRKEKKVYYLSRSGEHMRELSQFVSRNKSKFCRTVKKLRWVEGWNTIAPEGADVILDEVMSGSRALLCLSSQHEDQIVAFVCTGWWGDVTSRNQRDEDDSIDVEKYESRGFLITELQTVFRSTRQIQLFFHEFHRDKSEGELISGHNFNGIKVEERIFDDKEKLKKALDERIERLIQIEGCERGAIGLFQPERYRKPQVINNIFNDYYNLRSLEFPVMIVVEPREKDSYLSLSRAVCHLTVFIIRSQFAPSSMFSDCLNRRGEILSCYHPQWDLTNEEISSSSDLLKRDGTPICIPPSWDLVGRYVGPDDERADGFDEEIYKKEKHLFAGDRSESQFLDVMRDLPIGGVLIGDIYSKELKHVPFFGNAAFSDQEPKLREFFNGFREQCLISGMLPKFVFKNPSKITPISAAFFQIDFLYFHQSGIYHFEIKTRRNGKKDDEQLERNLQILKNLCSIFCRQIGEEKSAEFWSCYFRRSLIFYVNGIRKHEEPPDFIESVKIFGKEELEEFWRKENNSCSSKNLFKDKIFRRFLLFLAGFRPDFFICPVKCALFLQKNIFTNCVNAMNHYRKSDDEDEIQNNAKTVTQFLQELKFVKNVEIDFGEYKSIYLTPEQQEAVGVFDEGGNFSPKRQLIFGPPGSGKSLILMLKIFIYGQIKKRKEKKLYYWSWSEEHKKRLTDFVSRNKSNFCREVKAIGYLEKDWERAASEGADVILDEEYGGSRVLSCLSSQHKDQIVALVFTGDRGNVTSRNYRDEDDSIDVKEFESRGFLITELQTVFRSTRQIQLFFHKFNRDRKKKNLISGHNFDGIKVEERIFEYKEQLKKALNERIRRLIQIEGCEAKEIGLFLPQRYKKPQVINNIFYNSDYLKSLEFPVMIVVQPGEKDIYLCHSRAVCHLIVFTIRH